MGKITKALKAQVVNNVLKKWGYKAKADALIVREKEWARNYIKSRLPEGFEKVAKAHPDWFPKNHILSVYCIGTVSGVLKNDDSKYGNIYFDEDISVPHCMTSRFETPRENPLLQEARELVRMRDELEEKTMMYLNSVSTTKRLVELYPEMDEYLPKEEKTNALMLPSQSFGDMMKQYI